VNCGLTFEEAIKFHGHLGPWLLIGYKAGVVAKNRLKPNDIHDLRCIVKIPYKIPYSCSIDGIQASTCCTLGKGNIIVENSEDFEFIFINIASKESLKLKLRKNVLDKLLNIKSINEALSYIMGLGDWDLFESS
jgi:formylmethanofuran dehydrogenase subunit E